MLSRHTQAAIIIRLANPYITSGFYGLGSNINAASPTDLGILNSETYDDGRLDMSAQHARDGYSRAKVQQEGMMPLGVTEVRGGTDSDEFEKVAKGRRKRKIESVNGDDDEEAGKRARGRPRVDPKDETAADVGFPFFHIFIFIFSLVPFHSISNSK